jgi:hypothetical protein
MMPLDRIVADIASMGFSQGQVSWLWGVGAWCCGPVW